MNKTRIAHHQAAIKHFEEVNPSIAKILNQTDLDEWFNDDLPYFGALVRIIIGQQLSGKAATAIYNKFKTLIKVEFAQPEHIKKLADQTLRDVGIAWAKVRAIKDLTAKVSSGDVSLDQLPNMKDQEVIEHLIQVKGIGPWTAEMFLMFYLGRNDVFSYGDLGLKKGYMKLHENTLPNESVISTWSPYKTYASIAMWRSLEI